jgi:tetratricopeptide (TPR) repeat protein
MTNTYDVFLSHSHADAEIIEMLAEKLEDEAGFKVWLDKWVLIPGGKWQPEMAMGLSEAGSCAVFIGGSTPKGWFEEEIERVIDRQTQDKTFRTIPVLLPGSDSKFVEGFLKNRTWVDYRAGLDDKEAFDRMVAGIKGIAPGRGPEAQKEEISKGKLAEPGPLPSGSHLPFARNAVFTGRQSDLLTLANCLLHNPSGQDVIITQAAAAATGYGGIGKSQLAVEFCYRYGRYFKGVYWIHTDQDILTEISICGKAMNLAPWPETLPDQVNTTLQAWTQNGPRLVILDNAEEPEVIQEWLPRLRKCRVLLTSRRGYWPPDMGLETYPLDTLPRNESLELLRKLAPQLEEITDKELGEVAEHLGDLPLALDLAGRYLARRIRLTPKKYLKELKEKGSSLKHQSFAKEKGYNPTLHETSLAKTFALNWDELDNDLSKQIFKTCGYCAPNTPIPWEILEKTSEEDVDIEMAVSLLEDLGLIQNDDQGPILHPLLCEFAQIRDHEQENLSNLTDVLADLTNGAVNTRYPEKCQPFQPHIPIVARIAEDAEIESAGSAWNAYGRILDVIANHAGAKAAFERALAIDEAVFGPDHPNVGRDVNNLGMVLNALGDHVGAKAAYERVLAIIEKVSGPDHPNIATLVNNLGSVLHDLGDHTGAKAAYDRALAIDEAVFGPDHPNVGRDVNNLGMVLNALGDHAGAKAAFERALAIDEVVFGPDHPNVATNVNNLGLVLQTLGDYAGAKAAFERALAIDEVVFGPDHPNVGRDVNNLGLVLQTLGDYAGAKTAFERALAIDEAVFGPDHPEVATNVNNLGSVLHDLGDHAGAKAAYERALAIDEAVFGPDHPKVGIRVNNLGLVLHDLGDHAGAKAAFERALAIDEAVFGPDHPNVGIRVNNLGLVLQTLGDHAGAKAAFERALAIDEAVFGPDHPNVAIVRGNIDSLD